MRQIPPLTTGTLAIQNRVQDFAPRIFRSVKVRVPWNRVENPFPKLPLGVGQVTWVGSSGRWGHPRAVVTPNRDCIICAVSSPATRRSTHVKKSDPLLAKHSRVDTLSGSASH